MKIQLSFRNDFVRSDMADQIVSGTAKESDLIAEGMHRINMNIGRLMSLFVRQDNSVVIEFDTIEHTARVVYMREI